jgi:hypothetical protein
MKKMLALVSLVALIVACGSPKPEATVTGFFDAVKAGNGETAAGYLSQASIDAMSQGLEELKADTTGFALSMMTGMLGVEITQDELASLDGKGFAALLLGSDMIAAEIGTGTIEVLGSTITGETATVQVRMTVDGEATEEEVPLVLENGQWKLDMEGMGF